MNKPTQEQIKEFWGKDRTSQEGRTGEDNQKD